MAKGEGRLGRPGSSIREEISHWIELKRTERALASSALRDAREEETLSIARKALDNSKMANIWAAIAALIAVIAMYIQFMSIPPNLSLQATGADAPPPELVR